MYYEEFEIGTKYPLPAVVIDREDMLDFARKYNRALIHTSPEYARKTRFKDVIAAGAYTFAVVHSTFIDANILGPEVIAGKSSDISWFRPVYAGDALFSEVEVVRKENRHPDRGDIEFRMTTRNRAGETVMTAMMLVSGRKRRPDA